jgi:hypothetical protein
VLSTCPLEALARQLANSVASFGLSDAPMGRPEVVRKAAEEAAQQFQGYAKARPSKEDAYAAALAFMRGQRLNDRQVDLVASALSERIREASGSRALGQATLPALLDTYARDAAEGNLWRLTWFGLLGSYFAFDPHNAPETELSGWEKLRAFLQRTWPLIDRQSGTTVVPDWVKVLRGDPELLGTKAAHRYALDYLRGDESGVQRLSADLGIPESSWFWHALVLSAVERSAEQSDERFRASLPQLLSLIAKRPVYRDDALVAMLTRYHQCSPPAIHKELRDYVVRKDVWRNPKLRAAGLATAWNRVSDEVWRMVLQWVNEANLKDFFAVLAARRSSDEGRLDFWSQYLEQITWTRLIFSSQTKALAYSNAEIRNLIAREEDSYATMSANADVDAFMMQLGNYIVVEFSRVPNAAYVYKADELPFEPYDREYTGTSEDLKHGWQGERAARFTHHDGWQGDARRELGALGIHPDDASKGKRKQTPAPSQPPRTPSETRNSAPQSSAPELNKRSQAAAAPKGAPFSMALLEETVARFKGAYIDDKRSGPSGGSGTTGRLWVEDPQLRTPLDSALKRFGFKWAPKRQAWYYPET